MKGIRTLFWILTSSLSSTVLAQGCPTNDFTVELPVTVRLYVDPGQCENCSCVSSIAWAQSIDFLDIKDCPGFEIIPEIHDITPGGEAHAVVDECGAYASAGYETYANCAGGIGLSSPLSIIESELYFTAHNYGSAHQYWVESYFGWAAAATQVTCDNACSSDRIAAIEASRVSSGTSGIIDRCWWTFVIVRLPNSTYKIIPWRVCPGGSLLPPGATAGTNPGDWSMSTEVSGSDPVIILPLRDSAFDLSGDGRFSSVDLDLASAYVGLAPPTNYPGFDLNGDGTYDQSEADALAEIVSQNYDSKEFGDVNDDGQLCFTGDYVDSGYFANGYTFDSANYKIALDFNLDGAIDSTDEAAYDAWVLPLLHDPDFNQDGNLDSDDVSALIDMVAGGTPPSSIDPDYDNSGNVDAGDVDKLIDMIAGSC